jgi:hypothetical protein
MASLKRYVPTLTFLHRGWNADDTSLQLQNPRFRDDDNDDEV